MRKLFVQAAAADAVKNVGRATGRLLRVGDGNLTRWAFRSKRGGR